MLGLFDGYSGSKSERALGLALSIIAIIFKIDFKILRLFPGYLQQLSLLYMPHHLHRNSFPTILLKIKRHVQFLKL